MIIKSLRYIPTIVFIMCLYIGNTLLSNYYKASNTHSNHPVVIDNSWYKDLFVSLEDKIKWCEKRYDCRLLAEMGFFEAGIQPDAGVLAVMSVVINRVESNHPIFVDQTSIPDVVLKNKQFSYRNGVSVYKELQIPSKRQKDRMYVLAYDKLHNLVEDNTNGSEYYYADYVKKPKFAIAYDYTITYGVHHFYKQTN